MIKNVIKLRNYEFYQKNNQKHLVYSRQYYHLIIKFLPSLYFLFQLLNAMLCCKKYLLNSIK